MEYENERAFFEKVNRILSGSTKIDVKNLATYGFVGCQRSNEIWINFSDIQNRCSQDYLDFLATVKGVNYHELAHWLFTDYKKYYPTLSSEVKATLGALEDVRIESLFGALYQKAKLYFARSALNLIDVNEPLNYLLFYGRKTFLPAQVIQESRRLIVISKSEEIISKAEDIIDKFILAKDVEHRIRLAKMLYALMKDITELPKTNGGDLNNSQHAKNDLVEHSMDKMKAEIVILEDQKKEDAKKEQVKGKPDKDNISTNSEDASPKPEEKEQSIEAIQQTISEQISEDIVEDMKAISGMQSAGFDSCEEDLALIPEKLNITSNEISTAKQIENMFKHLRVELSEAYKAKQKHGRINLRHAMRSKETGNIKVFRQWKPSKLDEAKLAVALLIDRSSSMEGPKINSANNVAWCLNSALTKSKFGHTCVAAFNTSNKIIKTFQQKKSEWNLSAAGGTRAFMSIKYARYQLHYAKKQGINNLILIIISDGDWFDAYQSSEELKKMIKEGIKVLLIEVGGHPSNSYLKDKPNSEYVHIINPNELPVKIRNFVEKLERDIRRNVK